MPIHVPPVSRRRFIARATAAGAVLTFSPQLLAGTRSTDENFWALLSDTHIAADEQREERGVKMAEHLRAVSEEITKLSKRPTGVLISGDCAFSSGQMEDYQTLVKLLGPLHEAEIPIHLTLGNHDNRERFWDAINEEKIAKRPLSDRQAAIIPAKYANWFVLDSLETTLSTPGLVGKEQLNWLAKALDENADKPALVVVHHNPGIMGQQGLKDTIAFFEVIRPRRQVKAYIYGHTHTWNVETEQNGLHLINLPPVSYLFRPGDPAGWVHANLKKDGARLELRCVDTHHKNHGQTVDLKWRT